MSESVPKVRFEGFSGEWKSSKLEEVAEFNPRSVLPEIFEYVDLESVIGSNLISHRTEYKNTAPSRAQRLAQQGDIFYQTVRPYQKNNFLYDLPYDNYVFSTGYAQMRPSIDNYFLFSRVQENSFVSNVLVRSTGTSYPAINSNDLAQISVKIPTSYEEQRKIGNLFNRLDNTITLQQQLIEQQQHYKKAMMQKMFPQKGESIPKVRFEEFTGNWEELRAENIFKSISEKNHEELPVLSATQTKGMVYRDEVGIDIKFNEKSKKSYKRVIPNQFVIHLRSFQGGFAFSDKEGITSPAYTILDFKTKDQNNPIFWKEILRSHSFIKRLETVTYGIRDGRSISYSDFSTLKFLVPSLEEQQKIGIFFKRIDDTINLHEKKLEDYQQLKKALLKRMFV